MARFDVGVYKRMRRPLKMIAHSHAIGVLTSPDHAKPYQTMEDYAFDTPLSVRIFNALG
jgi:hypothetical protein